ncbi:flavodoxin family protein [Thermodesulfobacteriota bacterium]
MTVLMISGSRNPEGKTATAANALMEGTAKTRDEVESIFLPKFTIERCRQCGDDGWGLCRDEGRCVIEDDLASIFEKIKKAEAVVFATPVYFWDLSESMRAFTDRMRRICRKGGRSKEIEGKPVVGVCVAGGGGGGAPECCVRLESVLKTCGFDVVDMYPARRQNLEAKLPCLRLAGEWLVNKP